MEMALGMIQDQADETEWRGTDQGTQMKTTAGWYSDGNGTNSSGFSGLPGGYYSSSGYFLNIGGYGFWWSSTEAKTNYAWCRYLDYRYARVYRSHYYKGYGFSVRCVRDKAPVTVLYEDFNWLNYGSAVPYTTTCFDPNKVSII